MKFAHLLGSDPWILERHFDACGHGARSPFQVISLARFHVEPDSFVLLLSRVVQRGACRLDNAAIVHFRLSGHDRSAWRHLHPRVFPVEQVSQIDAIDEEMVVGGRTDESPHPIDVDESLAGRWSGWWSGHGSRL